MPALPPENFETLRDFFRHAISRFNAAELVYGHGTDNAVDEAAFILLEALHLPVDRLEPFLDARLTAEEKQRIADLIEARVATRKPAAYLLGRTYLKGVPFLVEDGVIVPRSFIGELLMSDALQGEGALIEDPFAIETILDLCTGGGSLAILAAMAFPHAQVDAVDISPTAIALAQRNVALHHMEEQITLHKGDLLKPVAKRRYDLIISNPPYVTAASVAAFPPEYQAEPVLAHLGGEDGLDIVRKIIAQAPKHLNPHGALLCEIGAGRATFEAEFPDLPVLWLDTDASEGEVFWLKAEDL